MTAAAPSAAGDVHAPLWPWTLAWACLALPFVPLWPDYEIARRGIGNVAGAAALLALAFRRREFRLPPALTTAWLGLVVLHALSCLLAANPLDGLARTAWLATLLGFAALAAGSPLSGQLAAVVPVAAVVAGFGLAQALGLTWPFGHDVSADPVSTLGNRNVAAEFATLGTVAAAICTVCGRRPLLPAAAVALGAAYLWVNHSRSGLLAAGLTVVPLVFAVGRRQPLRRRAACAVLVLAGLAGGEAIRRQQARPAQSGPSIAPVPAVLAARTDAPPSTIDVRLELWSAGVGMVLDAPFVGVGAGQFKVHYPRYRTAKEIELSTLGREFAAAPYTAHNDPLEIAIETGLPGLGLYVAFFAAVLLPRRRGMLGLLPIAAFLTLGLVRSPLGNAPAAAFAFACAGAACAVPAGAVPLGRALRIALACAAAPLAWFGVRECAAQCAAAPFVDEARKPEDRQTLRQLHALDQAVAWCPWDTQLRSLRLQLRHRLALERHDRAALRALVAPGGDAEVLLRHTPYSTVHLILAARIYQDLGESDRTRALLDRVLALDPPNPEARLFLATHLVAQGEATRALDVLYAAGAPHARLRRDLARHLAQLADYARRLGSDEGSAALQHEADFIAAVDALGSVDATRASDRIATFVRGASRLDLRPYILLAAGSLRARDEDGAREAAAGVPEGATLDPVHARLLAEQIAALRALPEWARLLP